MDADTREIVAVELTPDDVGDVSEIPHLLDQIDADVASMTAGGAYDGEAVYDAVAERHPGATVIIPPRATAVASGAAAGQERKMQPVDSIMHQRELRSLPKPTRRIRADRTLSCSPFQAADTEIPCSCWSCSAGRRLGMGGGTIMNTTVDHALMRGLVSAGPVMRRGAASCLATSVG